MDNFKLIRCFGERLGIDLDRNPDGIYAFEVDGLEFAIHDLDDCGRIVLSGVIGYPPPEGRERLYRSLLEAQYMLKCTGGATFSINPDTGNLALCKTLVTAVLDDSEFFQEAESFINALHSWSGIVNNCCSCPEIASESEKTLSLMNSGLMSV